MKRKKIGLPHVKTSAWIVFLGTLLVSAHIQAQLHWPATKKEHVRVRLIALAQDHPRSSFFANQEVYVAEKQLGSGDESRLVKLVYNFLPYQPRLSEYGFEYPLVHELAAVRDPSCDETLTQMTDEANALGGREPQHPRSGMKYTAEAPDLSTDRHRDDLPCYVTTADDYDKTLSEPPPSPSAAGPTLSKRP